VSSSASTISGRLATTTPDETQEQDEKEGLKGDSQLKVRSNQLNIHTATVETAVGRKHGALWGRF